MSPKTRRHRRSLEHTPVRREIPVKDYDGRVQREGISHRPDDGLGEGSGTAVKLIAERSAGYGQFGEMEEGSKLAEEGRDAAGLAAR